MSSSSATLKPGVRAANNPYWVVDNTPVLTASGDHSSYVKFTLTCADNKAVDSNLPKRVALGYSLNGISRESLFTFTLNDAG